MSNKDTWNKLIFFNKKGFILLIALFLIQLTSVSLAFGQSDKKKVYVLTMREDIDPRMSRYVELGLQEAQNNEADYVVVDMDTYGGAVNDADKIRTAFLDFPKPIFVYINKNAASAGALIAISCDSIYMAPGSNIGAATVVTQDGQPAPEKYQAYMRSMMRSTAEAQNRNPKIAEAMVGNFTEEDTIVQNGDVLSYSTDEAIANNYCEAKVTSIEEILKLNNIENYELVRYKLSSIDKIIAFFLNPILRSILIMIILGGIYFELQTPGVGFPLIAAITAAVLYFVPSYLNGFAENWEIVLFVIGVLLIIAELFFIPGFGVAGIAGITLTIGSLLLVMINNDAFDFQFVSSADLGQAVTVLLSSISAAVIIIIATGGRFLRSKTFERMALADKLQSSEGYVSTIYTSDMLGKRGIAHTVLRPSGKVLIEGKIYDAFSRGDFIEKDTEVEVIEITTGSLKVKKAE
ncbi:MAG TPA: NfeD family protein [Cytophagaceae bacterium]